MTIGSALIAASCIVVLALGSAHVFYTYYTKLLEPYDPKIRESLTRATPGISRKTTVARSTLGFNASHALGLISFGSIYGYLSVSRTGVLLESPFLLCFGVLVFATYLILAKRYFFAAPFNGVALATLLYVCGAVLTVFHR